MRRVIASMGLVAALALPAAASAKPHKHVCGSPEAHHVRCHADVVTNTNGTPQVTSAPTGYGPTDLQSAYNLPSAPSSAGSGQTLAIVDAYDDPNAESDLAAYRSQYGLDPCTTANGCFRKVDQNGGTSYPSGSTGWSQEISLDLDMASAICDHCHIVLVEANSSGFSDLGSAVGQAAALGATQISNSYGGSDSPFDAFYESYYDHPGIDITASTGDSGYGVEYPAASQYVTAVGGTSLVRAANARGWSETAWSGAGSGCSAYISKPAWQTDSGCTGRTVADVSADADPSTGVAVYDTYGAGGWLEFGGTSVASPIIAGVDALAGGRAKSPNSYGSYPYSNAGAFNDITSGSTGSCGGSYLCTAGPNYDGPTGIGTPNGIGTQTQPSAPSNNTPPTISGTPTQNQTLTANPGGWSGSPTPTYTYQWNRCASGTGGCASQSNASTYTLGSADVGQYITLTVTATNTSGTASATSTATGPVTAAPAADFSLSAAPASQSIRRGRSATYTVTINQLNGFNAAVALTITGPRTGESAAFSPNPTTGTSSTLTVRTKSSSPTGTATLTITGTSSGLARTTKVNLTLR